VLGVDLVGLESSRDQLWAEAVEAYHLGEPWWLDGVDETIAATEQDQRIEVDPWESLVVEMLSDVRFIGDNEIKAVDIVQELGIAKGSITATHSRRVGRILDRLGWTRDDEEDKNGRKCRVFVRPEEV
jgi:predicted P-loop ATPase